MYCLSKLRILKPYTVNLILICIFSFNIILPLGNASTIPTFPLESDADLILIESYYNIRGSGFPSTTNFEVVKATDPENENASEYLIEWRSIYHPNR